jgi:YaiO family outer membrane protein
MKKAATKPLLAAAVANALMLLILPFNLSASMRAEDPDKLLRLAYEHQRSGNFTIAKSLCRQILNEYPHYVDARNLYARIIGYEGNYSEAIIQYDSALVYSSDNEDARFGKARVLAWGDHYDASISILESLVKERPTEITYLSELAKVRLWKGDVVQSYREFEKAYSLDTTSLDVIRGAARSANTLKLKDQRLVWYQRLLGLIPFDPEAQYEIRRLLFGATNELQVQLSTETFSPSITESHTSLGGEYYLEVAKDWKPFVHINRMRKFGQSETRFGGGAYGLLSYGAGFFGQILVSPSATVIPQVDLAFEFSRSLVDRVEGIFAYRYMSFAVSKVFLLIPGFTYYLNDRLWITSKIYLGKASEGAASSTILSSAFFRPNPTTMIRLAAFLGDEAFRATTLDEIVLYRSSGFQGSVKYRFTENLGIEGLYQFTTRGTSGDSHLITLTFSVYY